MLDIYKASAGSGKTFALTLAYFKIIFESPLSYRNILAVTFTNKATEEMKSRIINELHKLAEGRRTDYGVLLCEALDMNEDQLRNRASLLRNLLLHDYGRLSVTTIDRFFQRVVKAFTRELGIFPGYNVELDSDYVLQQAVDRVMHEVKGDDALRSWLRELINSSVEEGKAWSVKAQMSDLGRELFRENYMLFDQKVLNKFSDKHFLRQYRTFLEHTVTEFEETLVKMAREALDVIAVAGLQLGDFKSGNRGCASWFYKLAEGNFDAPTATNRKGAEDAEAWVAKKSPLRAEIEGVVPRLSAILRELLDYYDWHGRSYLSAKQLGGNLYQLGILNDLYRKVRDYCAERGVMLLSDTTHLLNLLIAGNDTSFLFEKCGNYYNHLMIDEFQDTSVMQWRNFRPLVANSLGEGNQVLIVGDVKQSIYRWRNGEWGLLAAGVEQEFKPMGVRQVVLGDNWRSAREIVCFNNEFFACASQFLEQLYRQEAGEGDLRAAWIGEAYRGLEQTPRKGQTGYVDLLFGPEKREEGSDARVMDSVIGIIQDIRSRGGRQKDVVVLVRNGKEGAFVAGYLMEYNKQAESPIDFVSNDSLFIQSSPCVQFVLAMLRYIIMPQDGINRAQLSYLYHAFVCGRTEIFLHEVFRQVTCENGNTIFSLGGEGEPDLLSFSLYETVETIIDRFGLKAKSEEVPYLIAFQDMIFEYEANNSNNISLFMEWWEKEKDKRVLATSEETDAVRILTIHKSKGLEFGYVILPFCSWELDAVRPVRRIWCANREPGFDALEYVPLNYSSRLADTIYREDYLDEHLKAYIDNLNLLYVALTRAKTELYIRPFTPRENKDGSVSLSDMGAFIWQVIKDLDAGWENGHYVRGEKSVLKKEADGGASSVISLSSYPVWHPGGRISVKYRYRDYEQEEAAELSALDEGKLLHEIFKSIRYAGDIARAVDQAYRAGLIRLDEREAYVSRISAYLSEPQAAAWFSSGNRVINERDILFPGGAKARPDRIVEQGGRLLVIDYKFGQKEEGAYLRQVRFYCNTLKKMGYPQVEGYVWYVRLEKIVKV